MFCILVWWSYVANVPSSSSTQTFNDRHHLEKVEKCRWISIERNQRYCQLLLLLLQHRRFNDQSTTYNPFREVLHLLSDPKLDHEGSSKMNGTEEHEDDIEMMNISSKTNVLPVSNISVDFHRIIHYMVAHMPNKNFLILLYSFLQIHPHFLQILQKLNLLREMLLVCLQGLYQCVDKSFVGSHRHDFEGVQLSIMYTSLTCIEMFIQEAHILSPLFHHTIQIQQIPWFKEKLQVNHKVSNKLYLM